MHARSTHGAAIDLLTGELSRVRFGVGSEPVVAWLRELPAPVRAAYEAGPTGFALARLATDAGIEVQVVAPSKTPRASGDRRDRPQGRRAVGAAAVGRPAQAGAGSAGLAGSDPASRAHT
jgi:hypothetical protein